MSQQASQQAFEALKPEVRTSLSLAFQELGMKVEDLEERIYKQMDSFAPEVQIAVVAQFTTSVHNSKRPIRSKPAYFGGIVRRAACNFSFQCGICRATNLFHAPKDVLCAINICNGCHRANTVYLHPFPNAPGKPPRRSLWKPPKARNEVKAAC